MYGAKIYRIEDRSSSTKTVGDFKVPLSIMDRTADGNKQRT